MATGAAVAHAAKGAGFPDSELVTAVAVAYAESGWNENALNRSNRNGTTDYGLWQINSAHAFPEMAAGTWNDPQVNAAMAYRVWKLQGWNAWSVHKPSDPVGYARYLAAIPIATGVVSATIGPGAGALGPATLPGDVTKGALGVLPQLPGTGALTDVMTVIRWLQDQRNWARIGKFVLGGVLMGAGGWLLVSGTLRPQLAKAAQSVNPLKGS